MKAGKGKMERRLLFSDSFCVTESLKYIYRGWLRICQNNGTCRGMWATLCCASLKAPFQSLPPSINPTTWAGCDCDMPFLNFILIIIVNKAISFAKFVATNSFVALV